MIVIKLTDEENRILDGKKFIDVNKEWKYLSPYFYKSKCGYYEVYSKDEYAQYKENEKEKNKK